VVTAGSMLQLLDRVVRAMQNSRGSQCARRSGCVIRPGVATQGYVEPPEGPAPPATLASAQRLAIGLVSSPTRVLLLKNMLKARQLFDSEERNDVRPCLQHAVVEDQDRDPACASLAVHGVDMVSTCKALTVLMAVSAAVCWARQNEVHSCISQLRMVTCKRDGKLSRVGVTLRSCKRTCVRSRQSMAQ